MLMEHQAKANRELRLAAERKRRARESASLRRKARKLVNQVLAVAPPRAHCELYASGQNIVMEYVGPLPAMKVERHTLWSGGSTAERVLAHWQGFMHNTAKGG